MDLAHLTDLVHGQDKGAELRILHPVTGEPMPDVMLTIAGPDSDIQRRAKLTFQDELYAFRGHPPADDLDRLETERLARCVVGWRVKRNGEDVPFKFSEVTRLLKSVPFVREQVATFAQSRATYFLRTAIED